MVDLQKCLGVNTLVNKSSLGLVLNQLQQLHCFHVHVARLRVVKLAKVKFNCIDEVDRFLFVYGGYLQVF